MLKLKGWGLRPWMEFEIDPSSGRYTKRRLRDDPSMQPGYSGWGQELKVASLGSVLCAVFLHEGEIVLRVGERSWNLFDPGLVVTHRDLGMSCEFSIHEPGGEVTFRYGRKDVLPLILDSTYDDVDMELANLPGMLPGWCAREKADLVALLEKSRSAGPGPAGSAT